MSEGSAIKSQSNQMQKVVARENKLAAREEGKFSQAREKKVAQ